MKNKKWMAILLGGIMAASLAAPCSVSAADKTTITFWHAMGGTNGEVLQQIVDDFNASQDEIEIKAEYQGTYDDTITKLKAAIKKTYEEYLVRMSARCMMLEQNSCMTVVLSSL